jgi:hypothetical protein
MRLNKLALGLSALMVLLTGILTPASYAAQKHTARTVSLNGAEYDAFLAVAFADEKVKSLQDFLQARGYMLDASKADVTQVDLDGKKAVTVALIPFMTAEGTPIARIAFWDGAVDGIRDRDAVAMQGEETVFLVKNKGITTASKGQFYKQLRNPLLRLSGPTPKTAPVPEEQVTDITPDGQVVQSSSAQLLASGCRTAYYYKEGFSLLGSVIYKFWQRKYWCYGSRVSNVQVSTYLTNVDPLQYYRGVVNQWDNYNSSKTSHDSMRQAHMENCVLKYGCIMSSYPAVRIIAYSNGADLRTRWH